MRDVNIVRTSNYSIEMGKCFSCYVHDLWDLFWEYYVMVIGVTLEYDC